MNELAVVAFGYLAGSIPFAFLLARRRGVDLRLAGSGNIGAANVLRTSGVANAVLAMFLDAAKGSVAVLVAQRLSAEPATPVAGGLAAIIGHIYPVWLGFRGGKGVATAGGVFVMLTPIAVAVAGTGFTLAIWVTRYISVGSMAAAVILAVTTAAMDVPPAVTVGTVIAAVIIIHRHRGNLARLVAGTERRVGQRL
jgi:glycerol-3-phosphate acyltransferase PlsY